MPDQQPGRALAVLDAGQYPPGYLDRIETAVTEAAATGLGVGLYAVIQQVRTDGHVDLADAIIRALTDQVGRAAQQDPAVLAELLDLVRRSSR